VKVVYNFKAIKKRLKIIDAKILFNKENTLFADLRVILCLF